MIIAEIGVNHSGDLARAITLIEDALIAGADCVKFQHFSAEELGQPELARFELGLRGLDATREYAAKRGIEWLCTPFGTRQLDELMALGCTRIKLSHRHQPELWKYAADSGVGIIASSPTATQAKQLHDICHPDVLLYTTTKYPSDYVDLAYLEAMRMFAPRWGFSDHTPGIETAIEAVRLGAQVIEKHFRGRFDDCYEADWSADRDSFAEMVEAIRRFS